MVGHRFTCITSRRFGTGTIIPLFQIFGTLPRIKHLLKSEHNMCNNDERFRTSAGISSIPVDLFNLDS